MAGKKADLYVEDLVYIGFNSRVVAMHRDTGETVWDWKSPKGRGYTAVLVDGDRLMVSVNGYFYCLHPLTGAPLWDNPLTGFGIGVPCIATLRGTSQMSFLSAASEEAQRRAANASTGA